MSSLKLAVLLVTIACALSFQFPAYDRCRPEWAEFINHGELYDCANPRVKNPEIFSASGYVQLGNAISAFGLKIKGKEPNPLNVVKFILDIFDRQPFIKSEEVYHALGVNFNPFTKKLDEFTKLHNDGKTIILGVIELTQETILIEEIHGNDIWALDSRGARIRTGYNLLSINAVAINKYHGKK